MPRARPQLVDIEKSGFCLDDKLRAWLAEKFPTVDAEATFELFTDKALAKGWIYANWPAAFRNYVRRGKEFGGVAYRDGLSDPAFAGLIEQAKAIGFRMPHRHESAGVYRTELQKADKQQARQAGLRFGQILKRVEK